MKVIDYWLGYANEGAYMYESPDWEDPVRRIEAGSNVYMSGYDAETGFWKVYGSSYWIPGSHVYGVHEIYHFETDKCTPPQKLIDEETIISGVTYNVETNLLNIVGGAGGDLNDMIGYEVEWRERVINGAKYTPWGNTMVAESSGIAAIPASVSIGMARQYRVRTIGTAGEEYYSEWVICVQEVFSGTAELRKADETVITLHVFDSELNYTGRIENWISMTWEEEYQGEGAFTLTVSDTDKYARILQRGCFISRNDRTTCMLLVNVERNGENHEIRAGGYTAIHMLNYRMAYNKFVIKNIEEGIYRMVSNNLRGLPLTCDAPKGYTDSVEDEVFDCPELLDAVLTLVREGELGIRTVFDARNRVILFEVYKGDDLTYGTAFGYTFSTEFGNLYSLVITEDDDLLKNVAVICGANPGCDKTTFTYEATPGVLGLDRRELLVDGEPQGTTGEIDPDTGEEVKRSFEDWKKAMLDKGKQALTEYNLVQTFEVKTYTGTYGVRYALGDKVTCKSGRYGLRFDARITQVKERYDANGSNISMTLGEPTINYIQRELKLNG